MELTRTLGWRGIALAIALGIAPFAFCWTVLPAVCWLMGWM